MTEKKSGPAWAMASMLRHTVSGSVVGRGGNTSNETSVERRGRRTSQDVPEGAAPAAVRSWWTAVGGADI